LDELDEEDANALELTESLTGQVSFEQVEFGYSEDKPLIRNFNLDVKPGEMVAIVGPTGAGKTTLINLLMRFYDVTSGAIKVDGQDIRNLSRQSYRSQFGMVLQDAWLYEGTIKENLRFGRLDATDEEIVEAAKAANVDHFIRTLPGGYNMEMNQESSNISQGQKQLLTIARALLADPAILILDEATSSVDTRLELLIQKAMKRLMKGRTSFVIAHRLSTIQEADKILVLKDGQIIEQGNHESLLADKGFYYNLYQSQFSESK
ncbi:TPA: ATP-binding cassette domain-containing protein, partial [Streptococcus suis]|nr:ATP-binding cassette domain-containing protein [Streptococcus suis]